MFFLAELLSSNYDGVSKSSHLRYEAATLQPLSIDFAYDQWGMPYVFLAFNGSKVVSRFQVNKVIQLSFNSAFVSLNQAYSADLEVRVYDAANQPGQ